MVVGQSAGRLVRLDYLELKPTQPKLKLGLGLSLAINQILELTKHVSQKLKEELEVASQQNKELKLETNSLKEELEYSRREGIRYHTMMKEKIESEATLKSTIISMKKVYTEELHRKEVEYKKEVEAFKEELLRMKKKTRKVRKEKEMKFPLPKSWKSLKLRSKSHRQEGSQKLRYQKYRQVVLSQTKNLIMR